MDAICEHHLQTRSRLKQIVESSLLSHKIDHALNALGRLWSHATPEDFGALAIAIVCAAWFFTRFYGDR